MGGGGGGALSFSKFRLCYQQIKEVLVIISCDAFYS